MPQILPYLDKRPQISSNVFMAPGVKIIGDVNIKEDSNIWYNSVIRGDVAPVYIGSQTNIQDGTVIHTSRFNGPCKIGNRVTVGHLCLLHACDLADDSFIGMGAVVMDKVIIEPFGFVAAKALITPGKIVRAYELWAGVPAKFIRKLTDEEIFLVKDTPTHYIKLAENHRNAIKNSNQIVE